MSDDRICVATYFGYVGAIHVEIRTINVAGACHTCVVGYVKTVVCEEEIVVAVAVDYLRTLGSLPAVPHLTGCNQLAIVGDLGIRAPAVAELGSHLTRGGVEFHSGNTTVP